MFILTGFRLKALAVDLRDVRIVSSAFAGAVGPAAMWVGARLRANFWAPRQRQAVFLRRHHYWNQVYTGVSGTCVLGEVYKLLLEGNW